MSRDTFLRLTGPHLIHVTRAENRAGLRAAGLRTPRDLALAAGCRPDNLLLRHDPVRLSTAAGTALLNHQRPLLAGRTHAFLDGESLRDWARQLDRRVFFWPGRARSAFHDSVETRGPTATLALDAARAYDVLGDRLDLCAINSGNASRRPAFRGAWIYVPATEADRFAGMRRDRGLKTTRDTLSEVSLRGGIDAATLRDLLASPI